MPVYDYKCADHGIFHELATLDDASKPAACPDCGKSCGRVIMFSPSLLTMLKEQKTAIERNEKSQHEPVFSTPEARDPKHGDGGCGCHHTQPRNSKLMYTAEGNKMFPSMRPWMISH